MTKRSRSVGAGTPEEADEGGAAVLEFALVATLLFTLVFAIIAFGLLLQRKQQGVQAAAEGSRAAVVVPFTADPSSSEYLLTADPAPVARARAAVDDAMADTGRRCSSTDTESFEGGTPDGLRCSIALIRCSDGALYGTGTAAQVQLAADAVDGRVDDVCIRVRLVDLNSGDHAIAPPLPFIQSAMPDALRSTSVAQLGGLLQ